MQAWNQIFPSSGSRYTEHKKITKFHPYHVVFLKEFAEYSIILVTGEQMSLLCVISSFRKGSKTIMQVSVLFLKDDINVKVSSGTIAVCMRGYYKYCT